MKPLDFLRLAVIIGTLPVTLTNGTTADATQVMADLNKIVNDVNANAAPLANTALLNANNNFTAVQSGIGATAGANFPIASQVQNWSFNTLTSTLGTNTITARIAQLPLGAYVAGQVFTFIPSQTNTGPASINIDALGSSIVYAGGATLTGGELKQGVPTAIARDSTRFNIIGPSIGTTLTASLGADVALNNTGNYFTGPSVTQGTIGTWLASGSIVVTDTAGIANIHAKLWDGTTVIASTTITTAAAGYNYIISLSGYIVSPTSNIRLSARDTTSTSGNIVFNGSGNGKDSTLSVVRIG